MESLDTVDRARRAHPGRSLMLSVLQRARQRQVGVPSLRSTDYINTIPPESEPEFPGDEHVERRRLHPLERGRMRWTGWLPRRRPAIAHYMSCPRSRGRRRPSTPWRPAQSVARVVAGVDGSMLSTLAIGYAFQAASQRGGKRASTGRPCDYSGVERASTGRPCDYSGLSYTMLRELGGTQWPCTAAAPKGTERLYTSSELNTATDRYGRQPDDEPKRKR